MQYFLSQVSKTCAFRGKRAECGGGAECSRAAREDIEEEREAGLVRDMPLPPDDKCDKSYDSDYTFDTTGKAPFC